MKASFSRNAHQMGLFVFVDDYLVSLLFVCYSDFTETIMEK